MANGNKDIEVLDENIKGKGINDLAHDISLENKEPDTEISQDFIDNRNYDKYDYYEFDRKKGTVKDYIIMFALYAIVVTLVVLLIIGLKYKGATKKESNEVKINEIQN